MVPVTDVARTWLPQRLVTITGPPRDNYRLYPNPRHQLPAEVFEHSGMVSITRLLIC